MKHAIASLLLRAGLTLGRRVDEAALRQVLGRLHPVTTRHPLVRIGGRADGGYLVPDDLAGVVACFSPGVGRVAGFESDMVARGIPCYLADGAVEAAPIQGPLIHFEKAFVGVLDGDGVTTLASWVTRCAPPEGDLLLQMDIEGSEWPVLLNLPEEVLERFRVVIVEFHGLDRLADRLGFRVLGGVLERLLGHFHLVHNHPNNWGGMLRLRDIQLPTVMEMTWLRRDRAVPSGHACCFPHPLDVPNCPTRRDIRLPRIWYRHD
ncbi:hypothetical protein [uncultured Lamprocystis sp.]|jgi:hypothetical protein|uniref:hypothetical protein n=1 Tax=uncultured Lamprocystis sp. TaxID=543132 RepID=UPI0025DDE801|nr:hypothetical protein [uncultured Lamprocystis sp.]